MFKNILVPTDGSDLSKEHRSTGSFVCTGVRRKDRLLLCPAGLSNADLRRVRLSTRRHPSSSQLRQKRKPTILADACAMANASAVSSTSDTVVNEVPYEAIIAAAKRHECDLIFMSSHGRRGSKPASGRWTQKVLTLPYSGSRLSRRATT